MNEGRRFCIVPSAALSECLLDEMVGREGVVIEDLTEESRRSKGYQIGLDIPLEGEVEWFIPVESVSFLI